MLTTTVVALMPTPKSLDWVDDSNGFELASAWQWETCQEHEKRLREVVKRYDQRREPRWKREEQLRKALR
jgi:hypothetical protein